MGQMSAEDIEALSKEDMLAIIQESPMIKNQRESDEARYQCGAVDIDDLSPGQLDLIG